MEIKDWIKYCYGLALSAMRALYTKPPSTRERASENKKKLKQKLKQTSWESNTKKMRSNEALQK